MAQVNQHSRQPGSGQQEARGLLLQSAHHGARPPIDARKTSVRSRISGGSGSGEVGVADELGRGSKILAWYMLLLVYAYLFWLAGQRVNYALVHVENKFDVARTLGGALMCLTVPLATYQIVLHLSNFVEPRQQSQIVRIVFMVPTYSVTAFLSLRFMHWSLFIATVRDCYEAYVIYCFLHFLVGTLGDGLPAANSRLAAMPPVVGRHVPPFCCLEPWQMGREFLQRCQAGVFQYVFIRLVSTAVALALQLGHLYTEGDFDPKRGYLWITVVTCCSQSWALYVLVLFYRATYKELVHIHPMGKFLAIKTIVFFSWWQGILIEILEGQGHFRSVVGVSSGEGGDLSEHDPSEHVAQGIQDLLICLEMLVAAVFFFYAFPLSDYLKSPHDSQASPSPPRQAEQHGVGFHSGGEGESRVEVPLPGTKAKRTDGGTNTKRKGVSGQAAGMPLTYHKSHPRLDLMNIRSATSSSCAQLRTARQQTRLPVWEALRQSACPMELRVDLGKTRESVRAQRGRVCEHFAFLTKRKVEARTDGGVASLARVMTL
ncbi:unnamed protein product [Ectocarpus sp. CCAP 1310/34]|nr:unnamed protein product [Ectocarpus sp. CCAP 1310/34]